MPKAWKLALVLVVLAALLGTPSNFVPHRTTTAPVSPNTPLLDLPAALFGDLKGSCDRQGAAPAQPAGFPISIPAAGTGASSTYNIARLANNTAVNSSITVPSASLGSNQYVVLGVGDPVNATAFTAAGVAETYVSLLFSTVAVPAAYLPNGTLIVNQDISTATFLTMGSTYTFAITWVHGYWWTYTENGNPIVGGTTTASIPWENGTYNLGVSVASGVMCETGYTLGPSFVALAYGSSGAATPAIPTTTVPWAVGVQPQGTVGTTYVPPAANAIPQLNASLGTVGIQGHDQVPSLGIDHLRIGSSVAYPGALASLWGNFRVIILNQSSVSPVSASLAYGGTQIFNATALDELGGNLPQARFTWQYSPAGLGTLNATSGPTVAFTAGASTVAGALWVNVSYNCSLLHDEANLTVTPTGGPSINSFGASPSSLVLGDSTWLNVTNASWPRPITYAYAGLPGGCSSQNTTWLTCTPTATGAFSVKVYLNDSLGHTSNATTPLNVYPDLAISSFTATPASFTVNTTTTIATVAVGGVPTLVYTYTGLPPGCTGGTQPASFTCTPTVQGAYQPQVFVNDSAGHTASMTTTITVNRPLSVTSFTAGPPSIPFGGTTWLNVTAAGGTTPYQYAFTNLPLGCTSTSTTSLRCTPTVSGTFLVKVNVSDASNTVFSASTPLTISAPAVPVISSFTATPNPVNVSQTSLLTVVAVGGTGTLTYGYTGLPRGCTTGNTASLACTPSQPGNFSVTVAVTDTSSNQATQTLNLDVVQTSSVPTVTSFTASPARLTVGSTTTFVVTATGGTGSLAYAYAGLPPGCASSSTATLTCAPNRNGTFTVVVYVNDSAAHSVTAVTTVTVDPAPASSGGGSTLGSLLPWIAIAAIAAVAVVAAVLLLRRRRNPREAVAPAAAPFYSEAAEGSTTGTPSWSEQRPPTGP